jgi:hypothetical protein
MHASRAAGIFGVQCLFMRYGIGVIVFAIVCGTSLGPTITMVSAQEAPKPATPAKPASAKPPQEHIDSEEDKEIRSSFVRANAARQKLWSDIYERLDVEAESLVHIPMAVSNEYQQHALRIAKLQRIGAIAQKLNDERVKQRVSTAISLENKRHEKAIDPLLKDWKEKL